jgi:hypothetical protein
MTALTARIQGMATGPAAATGERSRMVKVLLHAEGAAAFAVGALLYFQAGGDAILFLPLLLLPDAGLLGYLRDARIGAFTYNLVHNWAVGLGVLGAGMLLGSNALSLAGAVLIAHVGMDRAVGYGLKYATGFKVTHLQRV